MALEISSENIMFCLDLDVFNLQKMSFLEFVDMYVIVLIMFSLYFVRLRMDWNRQLHLLN